MPLQTSTTFRARAFVTAASMLAAGKCQAMGGDGIAESFVIVIGSYVLGVLVLSVIWWITKKAACGWLLLAFVVAPFLLLVAAGPIGKWSDARRAEDVARSRARNLQAFSAFCKDRKRVIEWRVAQAQSASLMVRSADQFSRNSSDFSASVIHGYLIQRPGLCEKTSLGYLEEFGREVSTYRMCVRDEPRMSAESGSRFELVLGEKVETSLTPVGRLKDADTMTKVSVRLMDTQTGTTLARDTIHILQYGEGKAVCPDGVEQIATLIADVFPK